MIKKLKMLETATDEYIFDKESNIILPNFKFSNESESLYLSEDIYTTYLDNILLHQIENVCNFISIYKNDYFISIDLLNFTYNIPNALLNTVKLCNTIRFYILPIVLKLNHDDYHSNVVIIDNLLNIIEYFEPHGKSLQSKFLPYNIEYHIKILLNTLFPQSEKYIFKNVQNNCLKGLQHKQNIVNPDSGHCLAWSLLFITVRINNLLLSTEQIIDYFNKKFTNKELNSYIKRFIGFLETNYNLEKLNSDYKLVFNFLPDELINISNRIDYLTKNYLVNSTNKNVNYEKIDDVFQELMSYSKIPDFNSIFFKNINWFYNIRSDNYNESISLDDESDESIGMDESE